LTVPAEKKTERFNDQEKERDRNDRKTERQKDLMIIPTHSNVRYHALNCKSIYVKKYQLKINAFFRLVFV
jgi:hypothetical protein